MPALMSAVYAFSPAAIPVAATAVLVLAFGFYVVSRRSSAASTSFLTLTIVVAIWMAAFAAMYSATDAAIALAWARKAYLGIPFIPAAIYWFTIEVLRIAERRRLAHVVAWSCAAFFSAIAAATDLMIPRVQQYWWGFYPRYDSGVSVAFVAFFFGYLVASLFEFVRAYPHARGVEKQRISACILAFAIAYLGCVDYLPNYGIAAYPFGYLAILGSVVVAGRAIRRYDLVALTPSLASREIISTMADVLFVCDREGRIEFANRAATTILGYEESELAGKKIDELLAQEAPLSPKLQRRSLRNDEYVFACANGDRVDLTLSIAPVVHDGAPAGAVIIGRDVRDRKRAEREVLQAMTLLQSTLESTADGSLVLGDRNRIVSYNQRFLEIWHIPQEMMDRRDDGRALQSVVEQLVAPEQFLRTFDALAARADAESFDLLELKDGRRFESYSIGRRVQD
ncbi:MAG TPA: PAS domain S-box protein, partial [Thermoanaerobaculia bacterium]|nr:PAS domain S-box protein [Thermoanaerobaculia bacterium]